MEVPRKYAGISGDTNERIVTRQAADASNDYIDPEEIKKAIENLKQVINTGLKNIGSAIADIRCGDEALVVADKTMQPIIDEAAEQIAGDVKSDEYSPIVKQIESSLDQIYENAVDVHDDIQQQLNKQAEKSCWVSNVSRVIEL